MLLPHVLIWNHRSRHKTVRSEGIEEDKSFNPPVCEDLEEELNPPDSPSASSHETGPSDPLLVHGQKWEILQRGMAECQRTKDGWRFAETRVRWQERWAETDWHDEEACFNHMMPIDYWVDCEHEHWMCLGVLYGRTLHPMGRIKDPWRTRDDGFVPPFRMRECFGLARDRFIDWERYL